MARELGLEPPPPLPATQPSGLAGGEASAAALPAVASYSALHMAPDPAANKTRDGKPRAAHRRVRPD
jgi:hypothetical protein